MKRAIFLGIALLTIIPLVGCACYGPGFGYKGCSVPYGCGPVDYVDGGPCAGEANCGGGYAGDCGYPSSCGTSYGASPCTDCLRCIGQSIRVVGEGALAIAAAPFVIVGHVICAGCNGYESYPNCGCSNEVYYGDNCTQMHDYCDPCGCGGTRTATSGCSNCSGGYVEGVQPTIETQSPAAPHQTMYPRRSTSFGQTGIRPVSHVTPLKPPVRLPIRSIQQPQRLGNTSPANGMPAQGGWVSGHAGTTNSQPY